MFCGNILTTICESKSFKGEKIEQYYMSLKIIDLLTETHIHP